MVYWGIIANLKLSNNFWARLGWLFSLANVPLRRMAIRNTLEDVTLPPINVIDDNFTLEVVVSNLGEDDGPHEPIHTTGEDDCKTDYAVKVVREGFIDAVAIRRRNKWCNYEVDVAEQEEDSNRKSCPDWRIPVVRCLVQVEMDESCSNEDVDDSKGV